MVDDYAEGPGGCKAIRGWVHSLRPRLPCHPIALYPLSYPPTNLSSPPLGNKFCNISPPLGVTAFLPQTGLGDWGDLEAAGEGPRQPRPGRPDWPEATFQMSSHTYFPLWPSADGSAPSRPAFPSQAQPPVSFPATSPGPKGSTVG